MKKFVESIAPETYMDKRQLAQFCWGPSKSNESCRMCLRIIQISDGNLDYLSTDVSPVLVVVTLGILKSLALLSCPKPGLNEFPRSQKSLQ